MSAGGINVAQPLAGAAPAIAGSVQPGGLQPDPGAAGSVPTAASVATQYVPVAGQQAGSVDASGGRIPDGTARTMAIAGGVGAINYQQAAAAQQLQAGAAQQQVVDPNAVQGAMASAPTGPAAWDESWSKRFNEAGAPPELVQQLQITGAMGADKAQLQQMLDQIKTEVDTQLAQLAHDHPDEFKKLRGNPQVDRAMLAQLAAAVNSGQYSADQLKSAADTIGQTGGQKAWAQIKPMLVYSFIPAWGAWRIPLGLINGGKDPLTGEKLFDGKLNTAMTIAMGVGGSITIANNVRGAMQVAQGMKLAGNVGSDAAQIAANEGVANLTTGQKLLAYLPGTSSNKVFSGISRLDSNLQDGIAHLDGIQQELAQNVVDKWRAGDISVLGEPASKVTKGGIFPNTRGIFMNRFLKPKAMVSTFAEGGRAGVLLDNRNVGKTLAADFAAVGVHFADDTAANNNLASRLFTGLPEAARTNPEALKTLEAETRGIATNQLLDSGFLQRPTGLMKLWGAIRPGPVQDALRAADNVNAGMAADTLHGFDALGKGWKIGVPLVVAAGGAAWFIKKQIDTAKEAAAKAAQQQGAGGAGGAAGGAEVQAALQQFAQMPAAQQQQWLQQQYTTLQQAAQQPNLTAEQQQQLQAQEQVFEQFAAVANGGAGAGGAATGAAPQAAGVGAAQPAATSGFTAQGLGLA
jgi:hypothetical protein